MTETEEQKKKRLETGNAIDLRNMVNQRNMNHGQVVVDDQGDEVIEKKMIHTMNRKERRRAIHQDKLRKKQEKKAGKK